jgi:hypothetical protein
MISTKPNGAIVWVIVTNISLLIIPPPHTKLNKLVLVFIDNEFNTNWPHKSKTQNSHNTLELIGAKAQHTV